MKTLKVILIGIGIWSLAASCYTLSFQFQIMEDPNQQANLVLFAAIVPLVWLGSYVYYRKGSSTHGYVVGQTLLFVAVFLDAIITVPFFVVPNGGNHYTFFTDLGFWIIALELVGVATLYYYIRVYPNTRTLKA